MAKPPIRNTWYTMMQRCYNKKFQAYPWYGGRGITVCERWHSYENFKEDMGPRPLGKTLDRIDGSKGYYPENCRWSTKLEQCLNRKTKPGRSGHIGISVASDKVSWVVRKRINGERVYLGITKSLDEAIALYESR